MTEELLTADEIFVVCVRGGAPICYALSRDRAERLAKGLNEDEAVSYKGDPPAAVMTLAEYNAPYTSAQREVLAHLVHRMQVDLVLNLLVNIEEEMEEVYPELGEIDLDKLEVVKAWDIPAVVSFGSLCGTDREYPLYWVDAILKLLEMKLTEPPAPGIIASLLAPPVAIDAAVEDYEERDPSRAVESTKAERLLATFKNRHKDPS